MVTVGPSGTRPVRSLVFWAAVLLGAMVAIEAVNTALLWSRPMVTRRFPYGYVTAGVWTSYAFVRPPHGRSTDLEPAMTATAEAMKGSPDLYAGFRLEGPSGFLNPPSTVVLLAPLVGACGGDTRRAMQVMDIANRALVLATMGVAIWLGRGALRSKAEWAAGILLLLAFFPLRGSLALLQLQTVITACVAAALTAYACRRGALAGILLGLACCVKPYLAILAGFALVRRQWAMLGWMVAVGAAGILASVTMLGVAPWEDYVFRVMPQVAMGYGFYTCQSFNALVHRWMGESSFQLGPASRAVSAVTLAATIAFSLLAIVPRPLTWQSGRSHANPPKDELGIGPEAQSAARLRRAVDMGIAALAATLASPIVWSHYYGWTVALLAACLGLVRACRTRAWLRVSLAGSYLLLGSCFLPMKSADTGPASLVNSLPLFGSLLLLIGAWQLVRPAARP